MGLLQDLENAVGFSGSDSDAYHDSGLDNFVDGIGHAAKDIALAVLTLGIIGVGLKIMTSGLTGNKKRL